VVDRSQLILKHFKKSDPVLFKIAEQVDFPEQKIVEVEEYFITLIESITSQQLAVKAADTIFGRFLDLFPDRLPTPERILKLSDEKLRGVGLSRAKTNYIKDLAQKIYDGELELAKLTEMSDEEVIAELTKVKGIGRWTAEMFLIFALGREDIFSAGDLGLINAIKKLYGIEKPTVASAKADLEKLTEKWKPYRSFASRLLWKSLKL
jgi:DNA-3-methyladenine glycosylase II